jgi:hypothetical protein
LKTLDFGKNLRFTHWKRWFLKKTIALRFENVKFQTNFAQPWFLPFNPNI